MEPKLPPEAIEQFDGLHERLDRLTASLEQDAARAAVPATLFHYTTSAGLRGITATGTLRLCDLFTMNDPTEMRHGVRYVVNALQEAAAKGHRAAKLFAWQFAEHLNQNLERISRQFVTCFTPVGDDLGQWRAYGENGKGFAIGFDGPKMEAAFHELPHLNGTFAVNYRVDLLREAAEKIVHEALKVLEFPTGRKYDGPTISAFLQALSVETSNAILYTAMLFKHPAYSVEREYRFHHVRPMDDEHGIRTNGTRSYIELPWKSKNANRLTHVILGPATEKEEARRFVECCLAAGGIEPREIKIELSTIPYRVS